METITIWLKILQYSYVCNRNNYSEPAGNLVPCAIRFEGVCLPKYWYIQPASQNCANNVTAGNMGLLIDLEKRHLIALRRHRVFLRDIAEVSGSD